MVCEDRRLNGSYKPCVNGNTLFLGKGQNLTLHRIKTPEWIQIKLGTKSPHNQIQWGLLGKYVKYTILKLSI